jgi:hypothetical protein
MDTDTKLFAIIKNGDAWMAPVTIEEVTRQVHRPSSYLIAELERDGWWNDPIWDVYPCDENGLII